MATTGISPDKKTMVRLIVSKLYCISLEGVAENGHKFKQLMRWKKKDLNDTYSLALIIQDKERANKHGSY